MLLGGRFLTDAVGQGNGCIVKREVGILAADLPDRVGEDPPPGRERLQM
jgi:hypothetical protein